MMRVPSFRYEAPTSAAEAAQILEEHGRQAMLLAGGTDLIPNMKRRHQVPEVLVSLRRVQELKQVTNGQGLSLGAGLTLDRLVGSQAGIPVAQRAVSMAADKVATIHIRKMGTLGGNLCLDTRCNYYNQNYEWRQAIDFCKKAPDAEGALSEPPQKGEPQATCWVAPGSPRCWAVSSSDTAPALIALGAEVTLVGAGGSRRIALAELYHDDGIKFLAKAPDEVLTQIHLPDVAGSAGEGRVSTYWKLRRRGSFDFPVLGVGAALRLEADGKVAEARVCLGAVASRPVVVDTSALIGETLSDELLESFAKQASKPAKPLDNTDYALSWRKRVVSSYLTGALKQLRGDDPESLGLLARSAARILPRAG